MQRIRITGGRTLRKQIIWIIAIIIIPLVKAQANLELCENIVRSNQACQLTTPVIYCDVYNYSIYNKTQLIQVGNLTLLNNTIYYLTFNQSRGDYLVVLCDDTSREIYVQESDETVWLAVIGGIFVLIWILTKYGLELRDSNSWLSGLKVGLGSIAFALGLLILNVSRQLAITAGANNNIISMFNTAWTIAIMLTLSLASALLLYVCWRIIAIWIATKKGLR